MLCVAGAWALGLWLGTPRPAQARAVNPGLCRTGQRQSPTAVGAGDVRHADAPAFEGHYPAEPMVLSHDGHTLRVRLSGRGELRLGAERYRATEFHFHTPGGDEIDGARFPFAAHLLHRGQGGQLLAVMVPFRVGAASPLLEGLLAHLPKPHNGRTRIPGEVVEVDALLPANRAYYRLQGSLTDAPCTESVQWLLLRNAQTLSAAQLARWQAHFADNMRAAQPLNGRPVWASS
ncbi:MAG: carbonic anhydrase [Rhodoferax sp.]